MAANQYGVDLAGAFSDAETIKGQRTRNKLSSLQLGEAERVVAERPEKNRLAKERKNMLTGLREDAATGGVDAQQQLLTIDPEGGPKFLEALSKMDDRKIAATKKVVDEIGRLSGYVLQGKTKEEQQRRYNLIRKGVNPNIQSKLPENYDPDFMELSLSRATAMDKILENPEITQFGDEDIMSQGGRVIDRTKTAIKPSEKGGVLKSGDESLMYRMATELKGGIFDQAGNITNLDPQARNEVQAIATEATKIYSENQGSITRAEAVKQSAKKYGLDIKSPNSTDSDIDDEIDYNDPEAIKNILLK
jgi:hypothetical protein